MSDGESLEGISLSGSGESDSNQSEGNDGSGGSEIDEDEKTEVHEFVWMLELNIVDLK